MQLRLLIWTTAILIVLLLVTNVWWINLTFRTAYDVGRDDHEIAQLRRTLDQAFKLMPALGSPLLEADLVSRAEQQINTFASAKDGCYWIHELGFKFDDEGRLTHVTSKGLNYTQDPCFPADER